MAERGEKGWGTAFGRRKSARARGGTVTSGRVVHAEVIQHVRTIAVLVSGCVERACKEDFAAALWARSGEREKCLGLEDRWTSTGGVNTPTDTATISRS